MGRLVMNRELKQRASEAANRMARAGMTLSAGIMQELIGEVERLGEEIVAQADRIRFLETEIMQAQAGNTAVAEWTKQLGEENAQPQEIGRNQLTEAEEMNY
jgi:hypothetical protein